MSETSSMGGGDRPTRAHEEMNGEHREGLMRAVCEALARGVARGHAVSPGPWAMRNWATERGRVDLRRAGFEERHDEELGAVWVRQPDGETLTTREACFVVPVEVDAGGRRSE